MNHSQPAQSNLEFALLTATLAILVIIGLWALGALLSDSLNIFNTTPQPATPEVPLTETSGPVGPTQSTEIAGTVEPTQLSQSTQVVITEPLPTLVPTLSPIQAILSDISTRILTYYNANNRWPRTGNPYRYSDIGLNQADWAQPVEGIYWTPRGDQVLLGNKKGDNLEVYVNDLNGVTLHLYNGWNIICPVTSQVCYYHTVAPGNEVDISTLYVTGQ